MLVEGLWRIHIKDYSPAEPYLRATYELLRDVDGGCDETQALFRNRAKTVSGNRQTFARAVRPREGRRNEHGRARSFYRPRRLPT